MARRIRWQIFIAAITALIVVVLLSGLALSTTTVARPLAGGTYVEAVLGAPEQAIPLLNDPLTDPAGRDLGQLLFDGLTHIGADGLPEAGLAESWEIDPGGEVYTFTLRRDVVWHDGIAFNADDVVFTLTTIQDDQFNGDPALATLWRNVKVERLDDYTVRCTLSAPYAPFLSSAGVHILPAHLLADVELKEWPASSFARHPVGTGPYRLEELTTEQALLKANPSYFGGTPFIEHIELRFIESPQTALSMLMRREVHALGFRATRDLSQVSLPDTYRRINLPLDEYAVLTLNLREPPLNNVELRQALARALDKDRLIKHAIEGAALRLDMPLLPGWWSYDSNVAWYAYDTDAAIQTLEKLGYPLTADGVRVHDGKPLVLPLLTDDEPGRLATAQEIARQWDAIGVQVNIQQIDTAELHKRLQEHDFVMAIHSWARLGYDPDVLELWHSSQALGGLNYAGLRDGVIDSTLVEGRTAQDLAARNEHYASFQQRWVELSPSIILYQPLYTFVASKELGGLRFEEHGVASNLLLVGREDRYRTISSWFINSSREIEGTVR